MFQIEDWESIRHGYAPQPGNTPTPFLHGHVVAVIE